MTHREPWRVSTKNGLDSDTPAGVLHKQSIFSLAPGLS